MDFLIIGNGFDIAHGLKTQYTDFLSFCNNYDEKALVSDAVELNEEFSTLIKHNIWLNYFLKLTWSPIHNRVNGTWIGFEKEISEIIQQIENDIPEIHKIRNNKDPNEFSLNLNGARSIGKFDRFLSCFGKYDAASRRYILSAENVTDLDSFLDFLYVQLKKCIRAFEIYCLKINQIAIDKPIIVSEHGTQVKKAEAERDSIWQQLSDAEKNNCDNISDLKELQGKADEKYYDLMSKVHPIDYLSVGKFSFVLSFNYTNTYERLYGDEQTKYCYIHGKAQENKECTNLILGIDDNLSDGAESDNFQCVRFKKYYQRIIYKTGAEYKDWLAMGTKRLPPTNYVHIVGHSLDRTDHDVLYEFFSDERFKIIVYYYDHKDFEEKVQNVIRLLSYGGKNGRDELISRVHGKRWTIKFTYLYDNNEGLFKEPLPVEAESLNINN